MWEAKGGEDGAHHCLACARNQAQHPDDVGDVRVVYVRQDKADRGLLLLGEQLCSARKSAQASKVPKTV